MLMHFLVTGDSFPYQYYLAIKTAIKTQNATAKVWLMEGGVKDSKYLDLLDAEIGYLPKLSGNGLVGKDEQFICSHTKDYYMWKILKEFGGFYFDLDMIFLRDITELLSDKEMLVCRIEEKDGDWASWGAHVVGVVKDSAIVAKLFEFGDKALNSPKMRWNTLGPDVSAKAIRENPDKVVGVPYPIGCGISGPKLGYMYEPGEFGSDVRVIHLYGQAGRFVKGENRFEKIDAEFVRKSDSRLANAIRSVLNESEYDPVFKEKPYIHFICTGGGFPYQYYLAVKTAQKTQNAKIKLWLADGIKSEYLDLLKDVERGSIDLLDVPSFAGKDEPFVRSHTKDFRMWEILYKYGGFCFDLDMMSFRDITADIGDNEVLLCKQYEDNTDEAWNSALVGAVKGSPIIHSILEESAKNLQDPQMIWGATGPKAVYKIAKSDTKVITLTFPIGGGRLLLHPLFEPGDVELALNAKVVHLYAAAKRFCPTEDFWYRLTPEYVDTSDTRIAKAIRSVLSKSEYCSLGVVEKDSRGQHYTPMFDYLSNNEVKNILEIGTNDGKNAVALMRASKAAKKDIKYYGFDLFEPHSQDTIDYELTGCYCKPPAVKVVEDFIKSEVPGAQVCLFKGDSKRTVLEAELPIMDLIYIDGGHSLETTEADWNNVQKCIGPKTKIFVDDYFSDFSEKGAKVLYGLIDREKFDVDIVGIGDVYNPKWGKTHLLEVQMAEQESRKDSKRKFRFHLLGLVHLPCSKEYMACAFTQKNYKLAKMLLSLGHEVIYYGAEGSNVPCSRFVQTHTLADIAKEWGDGDNRFAIGYDWKNGEFRHDFNKKRTPTTTKFYINCTAEINKSKHDGDFLLLSQGQYHKPVADAVKLFLTCEPGIGYRGSYCRFRAFESSYIQNFTYGSSAPYECINGNYYDRVIPNYFEDEDFEFSAEKEDYFLYIGRLIKRKGIMTAYLACKEIGAKLVILGQGGVIKPNGNLVAAKDSDFEMPAGTWEYRGFADVDTRKKIMAKAKGTFVPTEYLECFAGTHIESMLSGTPVITTNFGVFPGTVIDGVNGYRCNTLNDFVEAARNIDKLDPKVVRKCGERYLTDNVRWEYQKWFEDLFDVYESAVNPKVKGWSRVRV